MFLIAYNIKKQPDPFCKDKNSLWDFGHLRLLHMAMQMLDYAERSSLLQANAKLLGKSFISTIRKKSLAFDW